MLLQFGDLLTIVHSYWLSCFSFSPLLLFTSLSLPLSRSRFQPVSLLVPTILVPASIPLFLISVRLCPCLRPSLYLSIARSTLLLTLFPNFLISLFPCLFFVSVSILSHTSAPASILVPFPLCLRPYVYPRLSLHLSYLLLRK